MIDHVQDSVWYSLIEISTLHFNRIGRYHNKRAERKSVYICISCRHLAHYLVEHGVIKSWQGGFRRLTNIETNAIAAFKLHHNCFHTDPN